MIFPAELGISRDTIRARHEFFEQFPALRKPFTTQIDYWASRLLMTEQNRVAPPEFTLNFMHVEDKELDLALIKPEYLNHQIDEAADVGVVGFIAPAFWSSEIWKSEGHEVIRLVSKAMRLCGLSPENYASAVETVIREKNTDNYLMSAFTSAGNRRLSSPVYRYTASHLKSVRKEYFEGRLPSDANVVFKHRNNGAVEIVQGDKRYTELLTVAKRIDQYRDRIGASPIL